MDWRPEVSGEYNVWDVEAEVVCDVREQWRDEHKYGRFRTQIWNKAD